MTHIADAVENRLMGIRLQELHLGIGVAGITQAVGTAFHERFEVRPMGIVTVTALVTGERFVQNPGFLRFPGFLMAVEA